MYTQYHNYNCSNDDFNVVQLGARDCPPNFCVHYKRCQNYLLHYVYSGKGSVHVNGRDYELLENQAFILYPGQETWYTSDDKDPFSYRWVEFFGNKSYEFLQSAGITIEAPIHTAPAPYESAKILKDMTELDVPSPFQLTGMFWLLANSLIKEKQCSLSNTELLFTRAVKYIHKNLDKPTTVEDVAKSIGVTRGYLSRIFKSCIDFSPKQYIIRCHLNEAAELLCGTDMNISEIASAIGYSNPGDFTKAFVRRFTLSPSEYRKEKKSEKMGKS